MSVPPVPNAAIAATAKMDARGSNDTNGKFTRNARRTRGGARQQQQQQQQQQNIISDAVQEEKLLSKTLFKTKICSFWLRKCCTKTNCSFAHGDEELNTTPDFTNTMLCRFIVEKGVCKSSKCKYAHSEAELRPQQSLPGAASHTSPPRSPTNSQPATPERLESRCLPTSSDASTDCSASSPDEETCNFEGWSSASTPACLSGANVQTANTKSGESQSFQVWHSGDAHSSPLGSPDAQAVAWNQAFSPIPAGQDMGYCPYVFVPVAMSPGQMAQMSQMSPMAPPLPQFPSMTLAQGQGMQHMSMMSVMQMPDGNSSPGVESSPMQSQPDFGVEQMLRNAMPEYYEE